MAIADVVFGSVEGMEFTIDNDSSLKVTDSGDEGVTITVRGGESPGDTVLARMLWGSEIADELFNELGRVLRARKEGREIADDPDTQNGPDGPG